MTTPLTLIAVHGNGGGAHRFARLKPFVPDGVHLHAATLPGFADRPRDPALRSIADYARRLGEWTAVETRPRLVLGTGIGGSIALELAQQQPDLLDGLILHAPVGAHLDTRRFPRLMRLPAMTALGRQLFAAPVLRPLWRRALFRTAIPDDYAQRFFDEYGRCRVFGQMFQIITADWFAGLRPISTPTALLWGARERVLRVDQLEAYKQLLPNHLVHIEPEWDHFPMIEQPAHYLRVVLELAERLLAPRETAERLVIG